MPGVVLVALAQAQLTQPAKGVAVLGAGLGRVDQHLLGLAQAAPRQQRPAQRHLPGDQARVLPQPLPADLLGLVVPAGLAQRMRQRHEGGRTGIGANHRPQTLEAVLAVAIGRHPAPDNIRL